MSSEEVGQLELRLTKAIGDIKVDLLQAINDSTAKLSKEHADLASKVAHVEGKLVYINYFMGGIFVAAAGAFLKYVFLGQTAP